MKYGKMRGQEEEEKSCPPIPEGVELGVAHLQETTER